VESAIEETTLKRLFKEALAEIIEERREFFSEAFVEALENIAMMKVIQEREDSNPVPFEVGRTC
jgi:hypothetical protein